MSAGPTPSGVVLGRIAAELHSVMRQLEGAIGNDDTRSLPSVMAHVQVVGLLADEAAQALGEVRVADADNWLHSPAVAEAMQALKGAKR